MISTFKRLLFPTNSDAEAVFTYLRLLSVAVVKIDVNNALREHPDSQSLLSVSDVLNDFGVENVAVKVTAEQLG